MYPHLKLFCVGIVVLSGKFSCSVLARKLLYVYVQALRTDFLKQKVRMQTFLVTWSSKANFPYSKRKECKFLLVTGRENVMLKEVRMRIFPGNRKWECKLFLVVGKEMANFSGERW
jgi:hypothetical protein